MCMAATITCCERMTPTDKVLRAELSSLCVSKMGILVLKCSIGKGVQKGYVLRSTTNSLVLENAEPCRQGTQRLDVSTTKKPKSAVFTKSIQ